MGLVSVREGAQASCALAVASFVKAVSIIGTRPQLVKAAVVTRALRGDDRFDEVTIDTGQHYDTEMSELLLDDLADVRRSRNLDVHGGTPEEVLARMIDAVCSSLADEQPDVVLVYGDTNSTLAGAQAAVSLDLPVAHVEAGLRSFNPVMIEERNRILVDRASNLLLCPTPTAVANLEAEGITKGVHHVGDVMYDAALLARAAVGSKPSDLHDRLGVQKGNYAVATVHRAETTDAPGALARVLDDLRGVAADAPLVFPIHPRTRGAIDTAGLSTDGLITCAPVGYFDMTRLVMHARTVYTDSGGLQKEAYFHRVPCVTLRAETEWVETIDAGWNRLWTVPDYEPRREIADYGDGHAGRAITEVLAGERTVT
jgi:UDP-GlcNAc3NAcA epimerase